MCVCLGLHFYCLFTPQFWLRRGRRADNAHIPPTQYGTQSVIVPWVVSIQIHQINPKPQLLYNSSGVRTRALTLHATSYVYLTSASEHQHEREVVYGEVINNTTPSRVHAPCGFTFRTRRPVVLCCAFQYAYSYSVFIPSAIWIHLTFYNFLMMYPKSNVYTFLNITAHCNLLPSLLIHMRYS